MTLQQYIQLEKENLDRLLQDERPLFFASQSVLSDISDRIFVYGRTIHGNTFIYDYKKPLYVNPTTSPGIGFKPEGKPKTIFNDERGVATKRRRKKFVREKFTGKKLEGTRVTKWFPSYQAYRQAIGKEYNFVNSELTGDLKLDIENRSGGVVAPRKISADEYVVKATGDNIGKLAGLNKKYPDLYIISDTEKQEFQRIYGEEILRLINEGRP